MILVFILFLIDKCCFYMKLKSAERRENFITYLNMWTKFNFFFIIESNNGIEK